MMFFFNKELYLIVLSPRFIQTGGISPQLAEKKLSVRSSCTTEFFYHCRAEDLHSIRSSPRSNKICSLSLISLPSVKKGWKFEETSTGRSMKYTPTAVYLIHTDVQLMYKAIHCLWDAMKGKRTQYRQYVKIQPHGQVRDPVSRLFCAFLVRGS